MPLVSLLLRDDPRLQACLVADAAHVVPGAAGRHVGLIQKVLLVLDKAPISAGELRSRLYGPTTTAAVLAYKRKRNIVNRSYQTTADNIVGKMTIPVDSKDIAFQVAGYHAFKEAFQAAGPCLLEPIYIVTVTVPEEYVGAVLGDLSSRRGHIIGVEADGHFQSIKARVPQKELYHYSTVVRSLTSGRGRHAEEFSHYAELPPELTQKILAERAKRNGGAHE